MSRSLLKIRTAQLKDLPVLLMLLAHRSEQEQERKRPRASSQQLEQFLFSSSPGMEILLAEIDRLPVGFLSFFYAYSGLADGCKPILRLDVLYVLMEHQHLDISAALLRSLAQIALAKGCYRIEWTLSIVNPEPMRLCQTLGARISASTRVAWLDRFALETLSQQV